jgi:MFS family permease
MLAISGAVIGMILGGILTQYLDWRWCMLINAVFAALALIGAWVGLPTTLPIRDNGIDIVGAVTSGGGLSLLLYAFSTTETQDWTSPPVIACVLAGCLLLATFIAIEQRVHTPLVPLTIFHDRSRNTALLTAFTSARALLRSRLARASPVCSINSRSRHQFCAVGRMTMLPISTSSG